MENDSTYQGKADRSNFYFKSPIAKLGDEEDEYSRCWVYLSDKYKKQLKLFLTKLNDERGLQLPKEDDLTSYENPEYLWLAYELEEMRQIYNQAMINPNTGELCDGCKKIPYVQLRLKLEAFSIESIYPKATLNEYDEKLNAKYVIEFDTAFLKAFMNFIVTVFDDNPQTYIEKNGRKYITYQYKAPIYRIPPFKQKFETRHDIPGMIFEKAVQMLLYHELAHIGGGHLDLMAKDEEYARNPDFQIAEEDDADIQAICWLLGKRFLESELPVLNINLQDYKDELTMSIFAVYLLYTWNYSGKKRVWNKDIFLGGRKKGHLPYQLRTYRMLDAAMGRLKTLKNICAKENICTKEYICTSDGKRLEEQFFDEVENLTFEMINSFERSLHMFFAETEDICELAQDQRLQELYEMTIKEQKEDIPEISPQNIPWLLGYELEGQAELKRVNDLWKDVSKHLADNGTYCRLREFAEWVPLERTLGADHVRAI